MAYAIDLLAKKPDFDIDESFKFRPREGTLAGKRREMNELWRKRVKNDALSLVTAGKQWTEVSDILRKRYEHVAKRMDQSKPDDVFEAFMMPSCCPWIRIRIISRRATPRNTTFK